MRRDILELDGALASHEAHLRLALGDVEALRLLLTGGSVIDWQQSSFASLADVDRLLRLHLIDPEDPLDQQRLRYLVDEALTYVAAYLRLRVPQKIRDAEDVRDIFLWASDTTGFRRTQVVSCMVLKLMHVMQHLEAADLRTRASISEQRLHDMAHVRVSDVADTMREAGVPLLAFYGSRKTRMSVITKLITKRENVAAPVFDKLRYRLVVPEHDDIVTALAWLSRHAFPFNQITPDQSRNNLLDPDSLLEALPPEQREQVHPVEHEDDTPDEAVGPNEFSGSTYRMINFVVDLPVRLPDEALPPRTRIALGRVVHVTTEFQIVDAATAEANEQGENAHAAYKQRQHERVRRRLTRGRWQR